MAGPGDTDGNGDSDVGEGDTEYTSNSSAIVADESGTCSISGINSVNVRAVSAGTNVSESFVVELDAP